MFHTITLIRTGFWEIQLFVFPLYQRDAVRAARYSDQIVGQTMLEIKQSWAVAFWSSERKQLRWKGRGSWETLGHNRDSSEILGIVSCLKLLEFPLILIYIAKPGYHWTSKRKMKNRVDSSFKCGFYFSKCDMESFRDKCKVFHYLYLSKSSSDIYTTYLRVTRRHEGSDKLSDCHWVTVLEKYRMWI